MSIKKAIRALHNEDAEGFRKGIVETLQERVMLALDAGKVVVGESYFGPVNELRTKTLQSYIKNSRKDGERTRDTLEIQQKFGTRGEFRGYKEYRGWARKSGPSNSELERKLQNRKNGLYLASKKLETSTNEDFGPVNELKTKTLQSYIKNSREDRADDRKTLTRQQRSWREDEFRDHGEKYHDFVGKSGRSNGELERKLQNRKNGLYLAKKKLETSTNKGKRAPNWGAAPKKKAVMNSLNSFSNPAPFTAAGSSRRRGSPRGGS